MPEKRITNRIKKVLEEQGRSQAWLARMVDKSTNHINSISNNKAQPTLELLFEIAELLDVDPMSLVVKPKEE